MKYEERLKKANERNLRIKQNEQIRKVRNKYRKEFKPPATSKLMAIYLFIILNVIIIYAMIAMWHFAELTYLGVLITDIASQVIVYMIYMVKSTKENTVGGIVYSAAMKDSNNASSTFNINNDINEAGN